MISMCSRRRLYASARFVFGVLAALAIGACGSEGSGSLAQSLSAVGVDPGNPLKLVSQVQLNPRLLELVFSTPAMPAPGDPEASAYGSSTVRVLLPADYASSEQRYPVLYLLHGAFGGNYKTYTDRLSIEQITEDLPLIVVMPDGGPVGEYSDWWNNGMGGIPMYETYHVGQLIPWIDAHFRTVATREGRAVAGLSMGGFGAMSYAARHPDLFVAAAAFSGAVDTNVAQQAAITPEPIWGPRSAEEVRWRGANPVDLAENLTGVDLTLRTGNGMIGGNQQIFDPVEYTVHEESVNLHLALTAAAIPHTWDDYGPGGHAASYWIRDLELTVPQMMQTFSHPPRPPAAVSYTSITSDYRVYGWHVALNRPALEFSRLIDAGIGGFTLAGSGSAVVTTPPAYMANAPYLVDISSVAGKTSQVLYADSAGRLAIDVPLGTANAFQQFTAPAMAVGTTVYSTTVSISL